MTEEQNDFPEAWKPEPGDKIAGQVVGVSRSPDFGYGPYPIVTLNVDGTERAVHAFHHVLRTELARRKPGAGDDLEILYVGKRSPKSGTGNDFHVYKVKGGKEPEFDWNSELPEDERPDEASVPIPPSPPKPVAAQMAAAENFGDKPPF